MKLARLVDDVKPAATIIAIAKEFSGKRQSSLKNTTSNFFCSFPFHILNWLIRNLLKKNWVPISFLKTLHLQGKSHRK
jgi:hypothetical protein